MFLASNDFVVFSPWIFSYNQVDQAIIWYFTRYKILFKCQNYLDHKLHALACGLCPCYYGGTWDIWSFFWAEAWQQMSGRAIITFFLFFPFFSFPTSRFEPSWPKLIDVMSFWFCIRFYFYYFNCYLSCTKSFFYLFFVPFHPLVFSFIFFMSNLILIFFICFVSYYFLNWICFSVSSFNI